MFKKKKINKEYFVFVPVILFFVLSAVLLVNAVLNNSQADWAIVPDIRLVGEYKIGDGEWKPIVEGEHISSTKGDVMLKGVLEICDPETNDFYGTLPDGSLVTFTFNHINLALTENNQITEVYDIENPDIGEDACGHGKAQQQGKQFFHRDLPKKIIRIIAPGAKHYKRRKRHCIFFPIHAIMKKM